MKNVMLSKDTVVEVYLYTQGGSIHSYNSLETLGHALIGGWTLERIDTDGDYEPCNVKWETPAKQARNRRKQSRNITGVTGVSLTNKSGVDCYVAFWSELDGKCRSKTFSTNKYGREQAFELAKKHRADQIQRLNAEGAEYSDKHGR